MDTRIQKIALTAVQWTLGLTLGWTRVCTLGLTLGLRRGSLDIDSVCDRTVLTGDGLPARRYHGSGSRRGGRSGRSLFLGSLCHDLTVLPRREDDVVDGTFRRKPFVLHELKAALEQLKYLPAQGNVVNQLVFA